MGPAMGCRHRAVAWDELHVDLALFHSISRAALPTWNNHIELELPPSPPLGRACRDVMKGQRDEGMKEQRDEGHLLYFPSLVAQTASAQPRSQHESYPHPQALRRAQMCTCTHGCARVKAGGVSRQLLAAAPMSPCPAPAPFPPHTLPNSTIHDVGA